MKIFGGDCRGIGRLAAAVAVGTALFISGAAMAAACRVTDFTDRALSSLSEVQRLAFVTEMTRVEYERMKTAAPGSENHYSLITNSESITAARQAARDKLATLNIENIDDYRRLWSSDFLTDEQLRKFLDCMSAREPGLKVAGRREGPTAFNLSFTHITPIGIEKITTKLVATYNIANVAELDAALEAIGPQDNYTARTVPLTIIDPTKRAVVVMRAGWETPRFVYIPAYRTTPYFP
jgi:hypothetical protein